MKQDRRYRVVRVHRVSEGTERERLVAELETHSPEGRGPRGRWRELSIVILFASVLGAGAALVTGMVFLGGWAAAVTAVCLGIAWYVLGWAPDFVAGFIRQREHQEFERVVDEALKQSDAETGERES